MNSNPSMPPAAERKSRSGCLIALYVVLGLGVLVLVVGSLGVWLFLRSETGQRVVRATRDGISLFTEATRAPGTQQLRDAGCSQAMVLPMGRMAELLESLGADASDAPEVFDREDEIIVMCQVANAEARAPSCDEAARIFIDASEQVPDTFSVTIQQGSGGSRCEARYARDGSRIEEPSDPPPAEPAERGPAPPEPVERPTP